MEKVTAEYLTIYSSDGDGDDYEVVEITCPHCGNCEELPVDEQRTHFQHFDIADMEKLGDEEWVKQQYQWVYECCECKGILAVIYEDDKEYEHAT